VGRARNEAEGNFSYLSVSPEKFVIFAIPFCLHYGTDFKGEDKPYSDINTQVRKIAFCFIPRATHLMNGCRIIFSPVFFSGFYCTVEFSRN
jgi:hypothetical protein